MTTQTQNQTQTQTQTLELFEFGLDPLPEHESFSPFCIKVHRALKAVGLRYTRTALAMPSKARAFNRAAQVPVLRVDGRYVVDSTQILAAINDMSGGVFSLSQAREDAEARFWEDWADTTLNGFLVAARWADEESWARARVAFFGGMPAPLAWVIGGMLRRGVLKSLYARDITRAGMAACWARFAQALDDLERRAPQRGFWMGDRLSVADFGLFGQLHSLCTDLTPGQRDAVEGRVALRGWMERVARATAQPVLPVLRAAA
jgi:glutathione S-transferase